METLLRNRLREVVCGVSSGLFRDKPITEWPAPVGRLCEISLPRGTAPRPVPEPRGAAHIGIIFELLQLTSQIEGDLAECGVFRGATLIPMAVYLKQSGSKKNLFGLDSFTGFDETVQVDIRLGGEKDSEKKIRGFGRTSLNHVRNKIKMFGVDSFVRLVPGFFQQTLPSIKDLKFSFVHLDCDLYTSYRICLEFFYERMSRGGVILLDEYQDPHWPGCVRAVSEFLQDKPEKCIEIARDNYLKYYVCKK